MRLLAELIVRRRQDTVERDREIVRSIVAAGSALGLDIVGEGVEDSQTLSLLRDCGAGYAQGYHLGRPRRAAPAPTPTGRPA